MTDTLSTLESRSLFARLNLRLMPLLLAMYVMAFLNRTNLGFAKSAFQADTGISDAAFAFGASIFFLSYAALEIPSNLILARVGARVWLTRIMITWGIISAAMAFVHSDTQFFAVRVLLGAAEAGFFPGAILYLTLWYPPQIRASTMGVFYFGAPLASIFGGPLSGLLLAMDGVAGLHGWQWMFLVEGIFASLIAIIVWLSLDSRPEEAKWLTDAEKAYLADNVRNERDISTKTRTFTRGNLKLLSLAVIYFFVQAGVYGFVFYLPTQVAGVLHSAVNVKVGFVTALPWISGLVGVYCVPRWSDRIKRPYITVAGILLIAGAALAASTIAMSAFWALLALCVACAGMLAVQPIFWTFPNNIQSSLAAPSKLALINSLGLLGGFAAPNLRAWVDQISHIPNAGTAALGITVASSAIFVPLLVPARGQRR